MTNPTNIIEAAREWLDGNFEEPANWTEQDDTTKEELEAAKKALSTAHPKEKK